MLSSRGGMWPLVRGLCQERIISFFSGALDMGFTDFGGGVVGL